MKRNRASASFLTRLGRDVRGNTIAIAAAAMVPLAGLIGGGVDMSRLYLTKTRLQQACDAGALAGRKAMGAGSWTSSGTGNTRSRAYELFDSNFKNGAYGTGAREREYTESAGTVTGTATVPVPMTIMRVFGMTQRSLTVTCTAKMEIPNTDVMFVLDNTGSMNCAPGTNCYSSTPVTNAKITGLKSAVKCFYEALLKVNTAEVCGSDPTGSTYTGTAQIRIGFIPYSVNVNLGKLLPNDYFSDTRTFQTRVANTSTVQTWSLGTESSISGWGDWSSAPSGLTTASTYSGWSTIPSNPGSVTIAGVSYPRYRTANNSTDCTSPNINNGAIGYTDVGGVQSPGLVSTSPNPPTYPATSQTLSYDQDDDHTATAYKYTWDTNWNNNKCRLQLATRSYTLTRTGGQSTKAITWTPYERLDNWTYRAASLNISGLKAGGSSWNGSVSLPLGWTTSPSVHLSGSSSASNITLVANSNVTWGGCIEERQTVQNSDGTPAGEWSPIPTAAYDLNIDMVPSTTDATTQWGPVLQNAVWARYSGGSDTVSNVTTSNDLSHNLSYSCPVEAKKLQTWYTSPSFVTYVDSLLATGNTYHDIGMIWGARFISPTGIFASQNAATSTGGPIQRHIIFMTDGDTNTATDNYSAHGIGWWDRRQTTYAPSGTNLDDILDARLDALCTAIKNKNITLWVVSYGGNYSTATETRLGACASPGKYFSAASTSTLIANFKQIASEIAELRLTS